MRSRGNIGEGWCVICRDSVWLLHDLAVALSNHHITLVIVTGSQCRNPPIDALRARPYVPAIPNGPCRIRPPVFWTIFMALTDLVVPQAVVSSLRANNKKQALQELAARAAAICGRSEREVLEVLMQRERLGSTGIGNGIAIPHGKLARLERLFGVFARLERPIDFEALDGQPVDLMFLLLAPEGAGADHLKALARIARLLRDPEIAHKLRQARDAEAIYAVLTSAPK